MGGGGTRAALGRPDGTIVGANAAATVDAAIAPLLGLARVDRWVVNVGLAGISRPGRRARVLRSLQALQAREVTLTSDAEVALWGALPEGEGVAVLAGTGSIALAREAVSGREARSGGYGYLLGDDGSAVWIGREAVRAALAAAEGRGPATRLSAVGKNAVRLNAQDLARLAPKVSQAAAEGDPIAADILARAGQALSDLAIAAAQAIWPEGPPDGLQVASCGGVWQAGQLVLEPFREAIRKGLPGAAVVRPAMTPLGGALLLACRRASGTRPGDSDADRVEKIASRLCG